MTIKKRDGGVVSPYTSYVIGEKEDPDGQYGHIIGLS
jgi:hypothetical protein